MREGNNTLALRDKVAAADPVIRTMRDDLRLVSSPNSPPLKTVTPPKAEPQRNPTVRAELQRNPAVRAEPQLSRSANPVSTGRNPTGRATPSPPRPPSLPPTTHQPPQPPPQLPLPPRPADSKPTPAKPPAASQQPQQKKSF
ncbi:hypothetical protein IH781_02870, partial [Patescibacteria group bacterium]|nr:hypothetical protein [Patescibacteria group bacterium]